jgi:hypothetical protein
MTLEAGLNRWLEAIDDTELPNEIEELGKRLVGIHIQGVKDAVDLTKQVAEALRDGTVSQIRELLTEENIQAIKAMEQIQRGRS